MDVRTRCRRIRYRALRTDARVVTLHDCGHMMMAEQPETTLQAMRDALGAVQRSA